MERITGIQEHQIVACCQPQTLIHGVIETFVGLRQDHHLVRALCLVGLSHTDSFILRGPINDQVLYLLPRLCFHAVEGALQDAGGVIGNGDNGYLHDDLSLILGKNQRLI